MRHYIGSMTCDGDYLSHYGIKGQKWGVRRYENEDGTLTPAGRERYGVGSSGIRTKGRDIYEKLQIRRMNRASKKINRYEGQKVKAGERDGYITFSEKEANNMNSRQNKRIEKHAKRFDEAKEKLDTYNNASEEYRKKARNSVRAARIGKVAAAAIIGLGVAAAAITVSQPYVKCVANGVKYLAKRSFESYALDNLAIATTFGVGGAVAAGAHKKEKKL